MPIYDFICVRCGTRFDRLAPVKWREAGITCPECHGTELRQAVSLVGGVQSGGKTETFSGGAACSHCHSGTCSTCN